MRVTKRIISTLMSVLMVLTAIPLTVSASETEDDFFVYPLPTATVTEVTPAKQDVVIFDAVTKQPTEQVADLGVEYVFTPDEVSAPQMEQYENWICDYVVTFDRDLAANSFGLYGKYGTYEAAFLWPNDVTAGESYFLLPAAGLDNHLTYREVVEVVQAFTCGAFNLSEANSDALHHMNVKLAMWAPDQDPLTNPAAVKTVAEKEYDFSDLTELSYPLPTATVNEITPAKQGVPLYDTATRQLTGKTVDLGVEYTFTPDPVSQEVFDYYKNWICDYVIWFEEDIAGDSFGLYGTYASYDVGFVWPNDTAAGERIFLLQTFGLDSHLTYREVVEVVQAFTCGAFNLSTDNQLLNKMHVELVMWDPNTDPTQDPTVLNTVAEEIYPFGDLEKIHYPLPTASVEDVTPAKTNLPIYNPTTMTNTQRKADLGSEYRFTPDEAEAGQKEQYADWIVDVVLSFAEDVQKESLGLYLNAGTANIAFLLPSDAAAGSTISLFELAGQQTLPTYAELNDTLASIDCGAFNLNAANQGKTLTIKLVMCDPAVDPADWQTLASADYTFADLQSVVEPARYSLTVSGSSYTVSEDGGPATSQQTTSNWFNRAQGTKFDLDYTGEDGFEYWVNESNNIISTEKGYSFELVRDTVLSAVTSGSFDDTVPSAYVIIKNAYRQIQATGRVTEFTINELFAESGIPSKMGFEFDKWVFEGTEEEATVDAIAEKLSDTEDVTLVIIPTYTQKSETYHVTVQVLDQESGEMLTDDSMTEELTIGSHKEIKLEDVLAVFGKDAESFSFWSMDGGTTAASYDTTQFTVISTADDVTVTVVLNAADADPTAFVAITQQYASQVGEKYVISTTLKYYAPEEFTVHEAGFVYGLDTSKFTGENAEENLQIGKEGVSKHVTPPMHNDAIYTYNLKTSNPTGKTLYIRAFLIYEDAEGVKTLYTNVYSKAFLD